MHQKAIASASPSAGDASTAGVPVRHKRELAEALLVGVSVTLAVGVGIAGLWYTSQKAILENYQHFLEGLAMAVAQQVDPQLHAALNDPALIDTPAYVQAVAPLRRLRAAFPEVDSVYTVVRDGGTIRFVLDAADPVDADQDGVVDRATVWEPYEDADPAMLAALGRAGQPGISTATDQPYSDKWGSFMTGYAPFHDRHGHQVGVVGVDVDASWYMARMQAARDQVLLGLVPAGALIVGFTLTFLRLRQRNVASTNGLTAAVARAERTSEVLGQERHRLRNVIAGTAAGTWEWDVATGEVRINERWASMLGYTAEELGPVTFDVWQSLVHPQDLAVVQARLEMRLKGGSPGYENDFRMRHRDGRWVWVSARGDVIERSADGGPALVVGTHQDVTARKEAEIALKSSEAKFRGLFESSPIGIALNDFASGRFLEVNDALLAPTGFSREELLALTYWDITPKSYSVDEDRQKLLMENGGRYGPYEKEYIRKDGSTYPVLLSGMRMTDAGGRDVIWSIVQDISQRKALERELTEAARRDKLTGLANRALLMERIHRAFERVRAGVQARFAVLFLDFDQFKMVNDTLGHEAGDELLRQIASRLLATLRAADGMNDDVTGNLVARFGGDEFVILINDLREGADPSRLAERLLNALAPSYSVNGRDVHSTASIGIVTSEQCQESAEEVIRNADVAMYEAKRCGRACSVVFNEAMHTRLTRHVTIESGLRKALGTSQLALVYQPIVELDTGRMVSAEALLRWEHPMLGPISPAEFIPIAEESGLIVPLGEWVLQEACRTLAQWRTEAPDRAPRTVSVNVSRAELALGSRLLERIDGTLRQYGLPPDALQLEVTEREVMRDPEASHDLMHQLRAAGVRLAMDDFGTGTSSLGCLRDYPFDSIKVDRSFVSGLATNRDVLAVIHATITLVENLGMASVAEGVETAAQVAILQSLGCRYAQGYFFSRPVPAAALLGALDREEETNLLPAVAG
ncbi:MAG: EAL domain-containing protein [Gammaproteobacteria bacterium]|nr:EAL domain-containing protein [Gammaproteobacteria bacterium]